jgi:hypothetical protein
LAFLTPIGNASSAGFWSESATELYPSASNAEGPAGPAGPAEFDLGYPNEASLVFGGMTKIPESESEFKN